ncbi:structural maintenance of chromosomes protein 1A-like isoform X2 [Harpegnathos saltator]|uniref:structural maintenance of chromosomes protein 1A-like isoform X2 n=1 Tax=Harpegnathos saltator TaxID=610380 RepID=UPI000DBEEACE|nr:structural maintenance of chromosomes protein 1A-like isoform X2 [Harpegnathos saltator]
MDAIVVDTVNTAMQCIEYLKRQRIGVETFLPLNSLKTTVLKERLRDIGEPNVKLLYDVLNIPSTQVRDAVLFVIKNTLVCETPEDARRVAYEIDGKTYDCVSLDGCFYRRDGTMSGGQADLKHKAKQWKEQDIITLEERREQLKEELKDLSNVSLLQSELNIVNVQFKGLDLKNKFIEKDLKDTDDKIIKIHEQSTKYDVELSLLNETISSIEHNMRARDKEIENVKRHISVVENSIFADFCKDINVPDISYYGNHLWSYQQQKNKQIELTKQHDLIRNQLRFEKDRNVEDTILNWTRIMEQADAKLSETHRQENSKKSAIEQEEEELSRLQKDYTNIKQNLVDLENRIAQCKLNIDVISKSYLQAERARILVQKEIEQQKGKFDTILKECKMESITIPILSERPTYSRDPIESSSSSSITDSSIDWDMSSKIDFSQFPRSLRDDTEKNLRNTAKQLNETLTKIQNELEAIVNPDLKAEEKVDSIVQQIQEINEKLKKLREEADTTKKHFDKL